MLGITESSVPVPRLPVQNFVDQKQFHHEPLLKAINAYRDPTYSISPAMKPSILRWHPSINQRKRQNGISKGESPSIITLADHELGCDFITLDHSALSTVDMHLFLIPLETSANHVGAILVALHEVLL